MASKMLTVAFGLRSCGRMLNVKKVFKPIQVQPQRKASDSAWCDPHMNELPVPCGPWDDWYNERQSFYMKHLVVGALWFAFSVVMLLNSGIFFNFFSPDRPGPPSDLVEECVPDDD